MPARPVKGKGQVSLTAPVSQKAPPPPLHRRTLRLREGKGLAQGHTAPQWQSRGGGPGLLDSGPRLSHPVLHQAGSLALGQLLSWEFRWSCCGPGGRGRLQEREENLI